MAGGNLTMTVIEDALHRAATAVGAGRLVALLVGVAAARGVLAGLHSVEGIAGFGEWAGVVGAVGQRLVPGSMATPGRLAGWTCGLVAILATLGSLQAGVYAPVLAIPFAAASVALAAFSVARLAILLRSA